MADRDLPTKRPDLEVRWTGGEAHLVDRHGDRRWTMNPTALALWELCDGTTRPDEMVDAVCQLFDVDPTTARDDVERTLHDLSRAGLVEWGSHVTG